MASYLYLLPQSDPRLQSPAKVFARLKSKVNREAMCAREKRQPGEERGGVHITTPRKKTRMANEPRESGRVGPCQSEVLPLTFSPLSSAQKSREYRYCERTSQSEQDRIVPSRGTGRGLSGGEPAFLESKVVPQLFVEIKSSQSYKEPLCMRESELLGLGKWTPIQTQPQECHLVRRVCAEEKGNTFSPIRNRLRKRKLELQFNKGSCSTSRGARVRKPCGICEDDSLNNTFMKASCTGRCPADLSEKLHEPSRPPPAATIDKNCKVLLRRLPPMFPAEHYFEGRRINCKVAQERAYRSRRHLFDHGEHHHLQNATFAVSRNEAELNERDGSEDRGPSEQSMGDYSDSNAEFEIVKDFPSSAGRPHRAARERARAQDEHLPNNGHVGVIHDRQRPQTKMFTHASTSGSKMKQQRDPNNRKGIFHSPQHTRPVTCHSVSDGNSGHSDRDKGMAPVPPQPVLHEDPLVLNSLTISIPKKQDSMLKSNVWPNQAKFPQASCTGRCPADLSEKLHEPSRPPPAATIDKNCKILSPMFPAEHYFEGRRINCKVAQERAYRSRRHLFDHGEHHHLQNATFAVSRNEAELNERDGSEDRGPSEQSMGDYSDSNAEFEIVKDFPSSAGRPHRAARERARAQDERLPNNGHVGVIHDRQRPQTKMFTHASTSGSKMKQQRDPNNRKGIFHSPQHTRPVTCHSVSDGNSGHSDRDKGMAPVPPQPVLHEDPLVLNSPTISIPKKQDSMLKSNVWPNQAKFPQDSVVFLTNWSLQQKGNSLFISGTNRETKTHWNTNAIAQRVSNLVLTTVTGKVYILIGKMRMDATSGFPKWLLKKFSNGFPSNWKALHEKLRSQSEKKRCRGTEGKTNERGKRVKTKREVSSVLHSDKTPDSWSPTALCNIKVSRSGRLIKPPMEYWKGARVFHDVDMNVTIHKSYNSICNLNVTEIVPAEPAQTPTRRPQPRTEAPKQSTSSNNNNRSVLQRKVKPAVKTKKKEAVLETASSPEEPFGKTRFTTRSATASSAPASLKQKPKKEKAVPQHDSDDEAWTEVEIGRLHEAVARFPKHVLDYWKKVAQLVGTRSAEECHNQFTSLASAQVAAKKGRKKVEAAQASDLPVISARAGTLKRKQQVRQFLEAMPREDVEDVFSSAYMQNKRFEIPSLCLSDNSDITLSEMEAVTPKSSRMSNSTTPQCLHITPGMMGSPSRRTDDKYVYKLQKMMKKNRFDVWMAPPMKKLPFTPSDKRAARNCGDTEKDALVFSEMFPEGNGEHSDSEEDEEKDYYFSDTD